ncbi:MAG: hypothetical protein OJF60_002834 [Burkholderiaceae bacterium]|jgi:hypothetical protein|nr:MAG: hypothetical protein OJF60_002834 [Burkholderiaceae bacterium]
MGMHQRKFVLTQVMAHPPLSIFRRRLARYDAEHKLKSFSCFDRFNAMAFAQPAFHSLSVRQFDKQTQ